MCSFGLQVYRYNRLNDPKIYNAAAVNSGHLIPGEPYRVTGEPLPGARENQQTETVWATPQ